MGSRLMRSYLEREDQATKANKRRERLGRRFFEEDDLRTIKKAKKAHRRAQIEESKPLAWLEDAVAILVTLGLFATAFVSLAAMLTIIVKGTEATFRSTKSFITKKS